QESAASKKIDYLKLMVREIEVGSNSINMLLSRSGIKQCLLNEITDKKTFKDNTDDEFLIAIPTKLKRCGQETKLIITDKHINEPDTNSVTAIQQALKKALIWNQALITGQVDDMKELAKQENVTQRYVAHLIQLAFLAPDIIEKINKGNIPNELTLEQLKKKTPYDWDKQHALLKFNYK
ncbi:MAG: hypothetical protein RLO81_15975, partial [Fulvivirga sp.]